MAFFKELSERIGDYTLTLTITKDKGQLVVMLVPKLEAKSDDSIKEIIPLTVKGTPDQLDAGFILAISQGISMTTGLQTNIKEFEAGIKKAEKKVKGKDDKKDEKKEEVKTDTADENKMPFDDDNVNADTGEIKETVEVTGKKETAKAIEPKAKKPAEPKAKKEDKLKEEKVSPAAATGEIVKSEDDEW